VLLGHGGGVPVDVWRDRHPRHTENPTYRDVCSHLTGHAEAVEVEFDPEQISYGDLLGLFWSMHNPTTPSRQGPDIGSRYRSAIFVHDEEQRRLAEASKEVAQSRFAAPIVTDITPAPKFYEAEDYHQRYYEKRGLAASCHTVS